MKKCKRTISVSVHKRAMTPREAILRIKNHMEIHKLSEPNAIYITEALNMAMQALEKQIPKKPINIASITYIPACPQCKGTVITYEKCCEYCGQALNWSDE